MPGDIDTGATVEGTPPPAPPDTPAPPQGPTPPQNGQEAPSAELEALRAQVATATAERDAAAAAAAQSTQELQTRLSLAEQRHIESHRRALLAEHRGHVVEELVAGATVEEIEASISMATAAHARIVESVRAQVLAEHPAIPAVPAGASPRAQPNPDELSPIQKLTMALTRNGS